MLMIAAPARVRRPSLLRNGIAFVLFSILLAWFLALSTVLHPRRFIRPIKAWLRLVWWTAGLRVTVRGAENLEPGRTYLYMVNHVTFIDHLLLQAYLDGFFVGLEKIENARIPIYGWASRRWGQVHIRRDDRESAIESCQEVVRRLEAGMTMCVFPEGTRTRDGALGPFKKGMFRVAVDAGRAVVPVAIRGLHDVSPYGTSLVASGPIEIRIGRPIPPPPPGPEACEALSQLVHQALETALR